MNSFLLRQVARGVLPVAVLFAVYLLLRGHDAPGGGFVAGLVTSAAVILHALANVAPHKRRRRPRVLRSVWIGLLVAAGTGLVAVAAGKPFLTHSHFDIGSGHGALHLSTTLLFDVGVFLVVVGSTITALAAFAEEEPR
ncbi:MnhB domain-containing protein [Polyangium sp. y55x31]|uniref:MnhB domain-containing protein n=1 Tax=Polyangium sp. y55x31 TaxID=3042688 RepID=UPI00248228AA|nr:MnhB domain-containing protein [Polyangium sp. y55x31]MDI1483621.1 MnhB domain-containing protein [Polyangium sp. y55x31]